MRLRQLLQPMMNELSLALEQMEKQTMMDKIPMHEHVYGWFLIKLESKIKRFILDQEGLSNE